MKLTTDRKQLQKFITPRISNQNSQINSLYKGIEKVYNLCLNGLANFSTKNHQNAIASARADRQNRIRCRWHNGKRFTLIPSTDHVQVLPICSLSSSKSPSQTSLETKEHSTKIVRRKQRKRDPNT
jgi:hypothetical protein